MTDNELFYLSILAGLIFAIWLAGAIYANTRRRK